MATWIEERLLQEALTAVIFPQEVLVLAVEPKAEVVTVAPEGVLHLPRDNHTAKEL